MDRRSLHLLGALFVLVPLQMGGCQGGVSAHEPNCSDYCDVILECDATQFYDNFPSLQQCNTNCNSALGGLEPDSTPQCVVAMKNTVACVGSLSCPQFHNTPCVNEYEAQDTACATD